MSNSTVQALRNITSRFAFGFLGLYLFIGISCQSEVTSLQASMPEIKVRLSNEPDRINPMLSRQSQSAEIERKIFLPLTDYNPFTLELEPILLREHASAEVIEDGPNSGGTRYDMYFRDEAQWDDGTPITGYDYLFTVKAAMSPYVTELSWRSHLQDIASIEIDSINPKHFVVETANQYMLNYEVVTTYPIYPAHIYDHNELLAKYSFNDIRQHEASQDSTRDRDMQEWATWFAQDSVSRNLVSGSGPYRLVEWVPNQSIIIERKENWWGTAVSPKHPYMEAKPERIIFYPIQDVQTAITSIKGGGLDVLSDISPEQFNSLKNYAADSSSSIQTAITTIPQYVYLGYNNEDPILASKAVRNAISRLMDVESLIKELFFSQAVRTIGPIIPTQSYYHNEISPIPFDPEKSADLLYKDGWTDSDNDGILDKEIGGQKKSLSLTLLTTRSQLSQDVGIILKNEAAKIGIELEVMPDDLRNILQKVRQSMAQMFALASIQEVGLYDPYNSWHSDNATINGNNLCKFKNSEVDSIIKRLRITIDDEERLDLYKRFQEIIHEEQPALFLVSPQKGIVANSQLQFEASKIRPGYFENTFTLKE